MKFRGLEGKGLPGQTLHPTGTLYCRTTTPQATAKQTSVTLIAEAKIQKQSTNKTKVHDQPNDITLERMQEDESTAMRKGEEGNVLYGVHDEDCTRLVPILGEELDRVAFLVVRDRGRYYARAE